jgi:multidrug efflux pump
LPPPILGLGQGSGYSLYIQDRAGLGYGALQTAVNTMSGAIMQTPGMHFPISTYQANVPQLDVQVDRDKAKAQGVSLTDLSVRCKPIWGRRMSTISTSSVVPGA